MWIALINWILLEFLPMSTYYTVYIVLRTTLRFLIGPDRFVLYVPIFKFAGLLTKGLPPIHDSHFHALPALRALRPLKIMAAEVF